MQNSWPSQEFLHNAGATVTTVSAASGNLPETGKAGKPLAVINVETADETGFDALFLPGGQTSADNLCRTPAAIEFVRSFVAASKPIAAIAAGVKVLAATDAIAGCKITADPALREPIQKAGGVWIDEPVATDRFWSLRLTPNLKALFLTPLLGVVRSTGRVPEPAYIQID